MSLRLDVKVAAMTKLANNSLWDYYVDEAARTAVSAPMVGIGGLLGGPLGAGAGFLASKGLVYGMDPTGETVEEGRLLPDISDIVYPNDRTNPKIYQRLLAGGLGAGLGTLMTGPLGAIPGAVAMEHTLAPLLSYLQD